MLLVHPWMLLGLLLVPAAVLLHVYRVPGRRHEVSWLPLWHKVLTRAHPETAERTRRFNWLLLLEILIITLLVLALAGPVIMQERPRRHVALVVDTSAGMNMVDVDGASRWRKARDRIDAILDRLDRDDVVSLYAGPSPLLSIASVTPAEARRELERLHPADVPLDATRLMTDAEIFLGSDPDVVFRVSHGGLVGGDPTGRRRDVIVGGPSRNVGIVAFSVTADRDDGWQAFVRIVNGSPGEAKRMIVVTDAAAEPRRIELEIPGGGAVERVVPLRLASTSSVVRIRLEGEADGLATDDEVIAVRAALPVIVAGVKSGSAYRRLFGGEVFEDVLYVEMEAAPSDAVPDDALLIVCGEIPPKLARTTVVVNPPRGELFDITVGEDKAVQGSQIIAATSDADAIARNVDLRDMGEVRCRPLTCPAGVTPLLQSGTDIVAAILDTTRGRVIVLSFDPEAGRWALTPSFVVFWANVVADARRRSHSGGVQSHRTGDVVRVAGGEPGVQLLTPSGVVGLRAARDAWASLTLDRVGLYEVQGTSRRFAANLLSEAESRGSVETRDVDETLPEARARGDATSLSPWLCVLAACLAAIWWRFRR